MEQNNNKNPQKPDNKRPKGNIWLALIVSLALILIVSTLYRSITKSQYNQTTLSEFYTDLKNDNLAEVQIRYDRVIYLTKEEAAKPAQEQKACYTGLPLNGALADDLTKLMLELDTEVDVKIEECRIPRAKGGWLFS